MPATQATKEKMSPVFSLAASAAAAPAAARMRFCTNEPTEPETRIRGFNSETTAYVSPTTWLSSTWQPAYRLACGELAVVQLVQRYYTSTLGRFMTPDPYVANKGGSGDPGDPRSWNRYAYSGGDPINYYDPEGKFFVPAPQQPAPLIPGAPGSQYPIANQVPQNFTPSLTSLGLALTAFETTFLQNELTQYLNRLQSQNSPCLSQLESLTGDSFSQIEAVANATQYFDLSSTAVAQLTFADVGISLPGASPQQSLSTYVYNTNPPAVNFDALVYQGPYVFLSSSFWNNYSAAQIGGSTIYLSSPTTLLQQQQTLFHELWHELGIGDLGGSQAFGDWLDGGCKGPPPGPPQ